MGKIKASVLQAIRFHTVNQARWFYMGVTLGYGLAYIGFTAPHPFWVYFLLWLAPLLLGFFLKFINNLVGGELEGNA